MTKFTKLGIGTVAVLSVVGVIVKITSHARNAYTRGRADAAKEMADKYDYVIDRVLEVGEDCIRLYDKYDQLYDEYCDLKSDYDLLCEEYEA